MALMTQLATSVSVQSFCQAVFGCIKSAIQSVKLSASFAVATLLCGRAIAELQIVLSVLRLGGRQIDQRFN